MKTLRVTMLFLLCVMLVVSAPLAAFAAPSNGVMRYGRTILQGMSNEKVREDLLCVYDRLVENCGKAESTIDFSDVSIGLTNTQIHDAFEAFHSDYPEYFWVPVLCPVRSCGSSSPVLGRSVCWAFWEQRLCFSASIIPCSALSWRLGRKIWHIC